MTSTKKAFGAFVIGKRQSAGLTQRDLAERLFVTESAVSKWERGVSYPDISLVAPLARELGVSETELINASDDHAFHQIQREARTYRRWKTSVLWATTVAYAVALLVCLIVNLAVGHTLDWFWIVAAAVALAASLTTLPLLDLVHRGRTVLGAALLSLLLLLVLVWVFHGGGTWLAVTLVAIALGATIVLGPIVLQGVVLPPALSRHRTVLALAADTVLLAVLLLVVALTRHDLHQFATRSLPLAGLAILYAWVPALIVRYLPARGLYRAALVVAFVSVYTFLLFDPLVARITHDHQDRPVDLSRWHDPYIDGNVSLLVLLGGLLVALVLAVAQALRPRRVETAPTGSAPTTPRG